MLRATALQALLGLARQRAAAPAGREAGQQLADRLASGGAASSSGVSGSRHSSGTAEPPREPWTPSHQLDKRKAYPKRMRHLITTLEAEFVARVQRQRPLPDFRAGDILEVTVVVPEAERRPYVYKGVCLARANKGPRSWFKIYNVFPDVGGFVQHFPIFMPDLLGVRVLGRVPRARRARLYHLRENESGAHTYQVEVAPPK